MPAVPPPSTPLMQCNALVECRSVPCRAVGARVILRALFGGEIRLQPQADGGPLARWNHSPLRCIGPQGHVVAGGRITDPATFLCLPLAARVRRAQ